MPEDNNDLMSFNSPTMTPAILVPEKEVIGLSPVVPRPLCSSDISCTSPRESPLAASTPFCVTHSPKFMFPGVTVEDDPFEVVERKAQQVTDPWEMAEAEAAKFMSAPQTDITGGSAELSKTQSLNTGFIEDSAGNCKLEDADKTISQNNQETPGESSSQHNFCPRLKYVLKELSFQKFSWGSKPFSVGSSFLLQ